MGEYYKNWLVAYRFISIERQPQKRIKIPTYYSTSYYGTAVFRLLLERESLEEILEEFPAAEVYMDEEMGRRGVARQFEMEGMRCTFFLSIFTGYQNRDCGVLYYKAQEYFKMIYKNHEGDLIMVFDEFCLTDIMEKGTRNMPDVCLYDSENRFLCCKIRFEQ